MSSSRSKDRKADLLSIYRHAVHAADPARCVTRHLKLEGNNLIIADRSIPMSDEGRLILLAIGKASFSMADATIRILASRISNGLVVAPDASKGTMPDSVEVIHGGHPLPTQGSLAAGEAAQQLLSDLGPEDVVLVLISGGGSALLELPKPGLTLDDLQNVTRSLLQSGAPIEQVNIVRKALSQSKAGGLVRLAAPAQVVGLILSDVVGDPLNAIASGPTVHELIDAEVVIRLLQERGIWDSLDKSVRTAVQSPSLPPIPGPQPINLIIGSNKLLVEAAVEKAVELDFEPVVVKNDLEGEARKVGEEIAHTLIEFRPGDCLIMGGETTVTVHGEGRGGRNQELALAAAVKIAGAKDVVLMSAASDGVDGPTDAAGAWVDGSTMAEADAMGMNVSQALDRNDSYTLLERLNRLIKTGPTGTNVNDLVVGLKYANNSG